MKSNELIRKLKADGWFLVRQRGSHMTMAHPTKPNKLSVPNHGSNEVATGLANDLLKQAGLK